MGFLPSISVNIFYYNMPKRQLQIFLPELAFPAVFLKLVLGSSFQKNWIPFWLLYFFFLLDPINNPAGNSVVSSSRNNQNQTIFLTFTVTTVVPTMFRCTGFCNNQLKSLSASTLVSPHPCFFFSFQTSKKWYSAHYTHTHTGFNSRILRF